MSAATLTCKRPGAAATARGMATALVEAIAMQQSSDPGDGKAGAYAALVKPGDAVQTPDDALWVVEHVAAEELAVVSAYRDSAGQICADVYEPVRTTIPKELTSKVADARLVRRP